MNVRWSVNKTNEIWKEINFRKKRYYSYFISQSSLFKTRWLLIIGHYFMIKIIKRTGEILSELEKVWWLINEKLSHYVTCNQNYCLLEVDKDFSVKYYGRYNIGISSIRSAAKFGRFLKPVLPTSLSFLDIAYLSIVLLLFGIDTSISYAVFNFSISNINYSSPVYLW